MLGIFRTAGERLNDAKKDPWRQLVFRGLQGSFRGPGAGVLLSADLPADKKDKRPDRIGKFPGPGSVSHKCPESLTDGSPFPKTSIFGNFGWVNTHPLYRKLDSDVCQPELSALDIAALHWRQGATRGILLRMPHARSNTTTGIIYTDAATSTRTVDSVISDRDGFKSTGKAEACRWITASEERPSFR